LQRSWRATAAGARDPPQRLGVRRVVVWPPRSC